MADREIRLIGSFRDDISPKLNKLNRQLLGTIKQFEKLQSKIAPVAAEMAKFNTAAAATSGNLKTQRSAIEENIRMLRQYRTELSKTATAQSRMGRGGMPRPPRGGGGGGGGSPIPPRAGGGGTPRRGGGGGGGYDGGGIGAGVFGVTLGTQLGNMMTSAIVAGFQTGTKLMMMPFQFAANALGERIRDEMQDIRSAGGLFSISEVSKQQGKGGLFDSLYEAEKYTKEQNRYLAKLAGSLPGDTQEYINVSRQIADGIFRIVTNDEKNAIKTAQALAGARGASPTEMKQFGMGGGAARAAAGKEMVGEMTKLTVLAGMGGRGGNRAHGLPMLIERMISEQKISMGMFQRYAAIFGDPMIKNALERNLGKINATTKDTNARFLSLQNTLREIVTDDLVERMRKSVSGTIEALRTAFLNPEVGLLGLGRPIMRTVKVFDKFGQELMNASGQIETDQIAIFDYLRDIFSGIMLPLMPIIDKLPEIFDPFMKLAEALDTMRTEAMFFLKTFNQYKGGLEAIAKNFVGMSDLARETFRGTIPFRAGLSALNNALRRLGAYDLKEFADIAKQLENPNVGVKELGNTLKGMIDKFLGSKAAEKIGYQIGTVVGIVIAQVGELMKAATGTATAGGLAKGFGEGFRAAGGPEGISNIIRSVFHIFGKLLLEVVKAAPLEAAIAAALLFLPGAIAGLVSQALSGGIARGLGGGGGRGLRGGLGGRGGGGLGAGPFITGAGAGRAARITGGIRNKAAGAMMSGYFGLASKFGKMKPVPGVGPQMALPGAKAFAGAANMARQARQYVPGGALAFGAVDAGLRIASGEGPGKAIGGAAASVIGSTLGGILGQALIPIPGLGAIIGGVAGGIIGDQVFNAASNAFTTPSTAQREAAAAQKAAAEAAVTRGNVAGIDTGFNLGTIDQIQARLQGLGLYTPPTTEQLGKGQFKGAGVGADFAQAYAFRNLALESAKQTAAELRSKEKAFEGRGLPPEVVEKALKPFRDRTKAAADFAVGQEKVLARAFAKMPKAGQDALVKNLGNMPTFPISLAIADVLRKTPIQPVQIKGPFNRGSTLTDPFAPPIAPPVNPGEFTFTWPEAEKPTPPPGKSGGRAFGGPVSSGKMYMVGERGPELFMSGSTGRVVPNNELGGNSVTVGTINVNGANAKEIADDVATELLAAMYRKSRSEVLTS